MGLIGVWTGFLDGMDFVHDTACATAASQRNSGSSEAVNIVRASSTKVQFIHSATPFCEGE